MLCRDDLPLPASYGLCKTSSPKMRGVEEGDCQTLHDHCAALAQKFGRGSGRMRTIPRGTLAGSAGRRMWRKVRALADLMGKIASGNSFLLQKNKVMVQVTGIHRTEKTVGTMLQRYALSYIAACPRNLFVKRSQMVFHPSSPNRSST